MRDFFVLFHRVEARKAVAAAFEEAHQGVIILGVDRVEFMIVAARAGDGKTHKRFAGDVDHVVEAVGFVAANVDGRMDHFAHEPEAGGDDRFVETFLRIEARRWEQVAGDVFFQELIVRDVGVEGADDVIAVVLRVRDRRFEFVTARFGVTDEIQPVPRPAFTELRRSEQGVDDFVEGVDGSVSHEGVDLCGVGGRPMRSK